MRKRLVALLSCLVLLMSVPLTVFAAEPDVAAVQQSPSALQYYASGTVTLGKITLRDAVDNELVLDYAYSPRVSISKSTAGQLSEILSGAGFDLPSMNFDYQLMNMQKFFVVKCTDGQALATMIESLLHPVEEESAVSASDAAVSATDAAEPEKTAEPSAEPEVSGSDVSASDAAVSGSDASANAVSAADVSAEPDAADKPKSDDSFIIPEKPVVTQTSLNALMLGSASFDVYPTVEQSITAAFPEFTFGQTRFEPLPDNLSGIAGVSMSIDKLNATVSIQPEPEYVEREVFGEKFTVLMVSNVAYRYELQNVNIDGACNGAAPPKPPVEEIVTPTDVTTTTETTTTTTTTATAVETTSTTTTTTAPTEPTATSESTTTTTTTTTAPTETTTTTTAALIEGGRPAYVSTRWKRLNVRTGPGTGYDIITQLDKGDNVTVLGQDPQSGWYKVRLADGTTGWCTNEYITLK